MKKLKKFILRLFALVILAAAGAGYWLYTQIQPLDPQGKSRLVRFSEATHIRAALETLEEGKVIRSASAARFYLRIKKPPLTVKAGTYELGPNQSLDQVIEALQKPVRRMVRAHPDRALS